MAVKNSSIADKHHKATCAIMQKEPSLMAKSQRTYIAAQCTLQEVS